MCGGLVHHSPAGHRRSVWLPGFTYAPDIPFFVNSADNTWVAYSPRVVYFSLDAWASDGRFVYFVFCFPAQRPIFWLECEKDCIWTQKQVNTSMDPAECRDGA